MDHIGVRRPQQLDREVDRDDLLSGLHQAVRRQSGHLVGQPDDRPRVQRAMLLHQLKVPRDFPRHSPRLDLVEYDPELLRERHPIMQILSTASR